VVVEVVEQPQLELMLQTILLEEQVVQEHQTIFLVNYVQQHTLAVEVVELLMAVVEQLEQVEQAVVELEEMQTLLPMQQHQEQITLEVVVAVVEQQFLLEPLEPVEQVVQELLLHDQAQGVEFSLQHVVRVHLL
jgi:hypothetical protein